ncbi:MAG: phosphatase PAP2 family protein [Bauldia sp.]|nr:phosphatase PAP2 family protein [Bauldia sp.]
MSDVAAVESGRFGRNLATLKTRLRRRRVPELALCAYPRIRIIWAGLALLAILVAICIVAGDAGAPRWAKSLSPFVEGMFRFVTDFGKSGWLLIPTGVFGLVVLFLADWSRVGRRMAAAWAEAGEIVGFFFFNLAAAGIITNIFKWLFGRSRPLRYKEDGILTFQPISFVYEHVSFPSGHATTAAASFVACAYIFRGHPIVVGLIGLLAGTVVVSRVAVGAHYPSDVLAGIFIGASFTVVYAYALGRSGVAFQRLPDGTLMPKTVAIRQMTREVGPKAMLAGLWQALAGGKRG